MSNESLGEFNFPACDSQPEEDSVSDLGAHRIDNGRVGVSENYRAVCGVKVNVFPPVGVPQPRAMCATNADRVVRATSSRVNGPGNDLPCPIDEGRRLTIPSTCVYGSHVFTS